MARARELLGPSGPLARALPGYEQRSGQLAMAEAVERALSGDRVVLCEAGTGTGKTLAYLLPALLSGRKIIISTATRALQEQIFLKDLPLVASAFGLEPKVALLKGVANYLCRRRHADFQRSPESLRPGYARGLGLVGSWIERTESGDLAELASMPEDDPLRFEIASSSDTRLGVSCPHFEECFVTRAKREAEAAQIVVVNHHLFFADLAVRGPHPARVLPDYEAVIFDEAHQLEDVATEFFSVRVSSQRLERLFADVERTVRAMGLSDALFGGADGVRALVGARAAADAFFRRLSEHARGADGRVALERDVWVGALEQAFHGLDSALEGVAGLVTSAAGRLSEARKAPRGLAEALLVSERRVEQAREQLATIVDAGSGRVVWLEVLPRRVVLSSSPVDLSVLLRERVFEPVPAVVLTSATLATRASESAVGADKSPFAFLRGRLGLDASFDRIEELIVSSPFDFGRQALLYTPRDLPAPGTPAFWDAASERIAELNRITAGGCFVLTTSLRAMRELHRRLLEKLTELPVMVQGEAPKAALISRFRAAENAVLVATLGFWEGVDVKGRALRLVVLEKIPFAVPSDPIVNARSRVLEAAGENAFLKLHVPAAALTLKQGFGRLIRTQADVGVVALLDERVHRRGYGKKLLGALPPARQTAHLADVRAFWEECGRGHPPEPFA